MRRREFITLLGGAAAWPLAAHAQPSGKVWRLGVLETTSLDANATNFNALRQGLRALGYIEGQNLVIGYRSAEGRPELFPELAAELLRLKVDLFLARSTPAIVAAMNAGQNTPVVMTTIADPFRVVSSIARPGGNVTGLTSLLTETHEKRVELLYEMKPGLTQIAYMANGGTSYNAQIRDQIQKAAQAVGLQFQFLDVRTPEDIGRAFVAVTQQDRVAVIVGNEPLTQAHPGLIAELAVAHRVLAMYSAREFIAAGGLIALGPSYPDLYRRAAAYVDKIIKGAKAGDLPIEQPTKFELIINLKAAKAIGLTITEPF